MFRHIICLFVIASSALSDDDIRIVPGRFATSPSRKYIATAAMRISLGKIDGIVLLDDLTKSTQSLLSEGPYCRTLEWLDDQTLFASNLDGAIIWDVASGKERWLIREHDDFSYGEVYPSPSGKLFAVREYAKDEPNGILIIDKSGTVRHRIPQKYKLLTGGRLVRNNDQTDLHLYFEVPPNLDANAIFDFDLSKPDISPAQLFTFQEPHGLPESYGLQFLATPKALIWDSKVFQRDLILDLNSKAVGLLNDLDRSDDHVVVEMLTNRVDQIAMLTRRSSGKFEIRVTTPDDLRSQAWDVIADDGDCERYRWLDERTVELARYHKDKTEIFWIDVDSKQRTTHLLQSIRKHKVPQPKP